MIRAEPIRTTAAICRHCGRAKVNRPRGLCWSCYYTGGVRERYPSTSKFARRGVGNFTGNAPRPPIPTTAAPGTPEKLEVLAQRARNNQALWHPLDATYEGDPRPLLWLAKVTVVRAA
jgi:ribosomal protein L37E